MPVARRLFPLSVPLIVGLVLVTVTMAACSGGDDDSGTAELPDGASSERASDPGESDTGATSTGESDTGGSGDDETTVEGGPPPPLDPGRVIGRTWALRFGAGPDGPIPRVDGFPITIVFEPGGAVGGTAACNSYGGSYEFADRSVQLSELLGTLMACHPDEVMTSEERYLAALGDVTEIELEVTADGERLLLAGVATELIFVETDAEEAIITTVPTPDSETEPDSETDSETETETETDSETETDTSVFDTSALDGVEWVFAGGHGPDGDIVDPRTISATSTITLVLADGLYEGLAVCNRYGGRAQIADGGITLELARSTRMSCGPDFDPIAAAYLGAMPAVTELQLASDGGQLTLTGPTTELRFDRPAG